MTASKEPSSTPAGALANNFNRGSKRAAGRRHLPIFQRADL